MSFDLFEALIRQVSAPRSFLLNYSGESTVYPQLIPAIRQARSTGAFVELVTALVNVAEPNLAELCHSGLNRLTVSVHTTDPAHYAEIYRYGSFDLLSAKLSKIVELCREAAVPPIVDLAFVAMDKNLEDLFGVARLANFLGIRDIHVFPVMRRDEIPIQFPRELATPTNYHSKFRDRVTAIVEEAARESAGTSIAICNPLFTVGEGQLGRVPSPYPGPLPTDARIFSCEQNPWETTHVLSNGDVVACEVLDKIVLGNLRQQSLTDIWYGHLYQDFRERYTRGDVPECRTCPWKRAYRPSTLESDIVGGRGRSAQLLHGWHDPSGEPHIWSSQQALAVISPREKSRVLHVSGRLPPGPPDEPNELIITCNEKEIGRVANPWAEVIPFGLDFAVELPEASPWFIGFRMSHVYRATERGTGSDHRDLGFALHLLTAKAFIDQEVVEHRRRALQRVTRVVNRTDGFGRLIRRWFRRNAANPRARLRPGVSVLIPERDNVPELSDCLGSVEAAAAQWSEPIEVIVVINGSPRSNYASLESRYPRTSWHFSEHALGFCGAVRKGLRHARFDWVYLLNSDVVLDPAALAEVGRLRDETIFSVASQILLKDITRFRDETNWTRLFIEDGLATIHDCIPESNDPMVGFYAGGGASLFQTRLLRRFARVSAYDPFYWEDVEWGWRARKLGFRSLFSPLSVANHTHRSTILRHYRLEDIDRVLGRNRFLFQLRNLTTAGSLLRVIDELSLSPDEIANHFLRPSTLWSIACGRIWNHLAPFSDGEVLSS